MAAGSAEHGISKALELKAAGNDAFKRGEYKEAMGSYHAMYMYLHGFSEQKPDTGGNPAAGGFKTTAGASKEEMSTVHELKVLHHSNLAMCLMKMGNFEKAKSNCTKALAIDPENIKARFRRGKCYAQLGALDEAKRDFEHVLAREPENRDARRELQALKGLFAAHKKREQKRFAGFFDKLQSEEPPDQASGGQAVAPPEEHLEAADEPMGDPACDPAAAAGGDPAHGHLV